MTAKKEYMIDFESHTGNVTFDDSIKNKVVGFDTLNLDRMPKLKNVLHVE